MGRTKKRGNFSQSKAGGVYRKQRRHPWDLDAFYDQRRADIVIRIQAGEPRAVVARLWGISETRVGQVLQQARELAAGQADGG